MTTSALPAGLLGSTKPLAQAHDVALVDLDGVCFAGTAKVGHAADSLNTARQQGLRLTFVTNNASRAPQSVVDKLADNSISATAQEVFTAAMDAAALLREHLEPGALVLVIGGDGLRQALLDEGYRITHTATDQPQAVAQGWDPCVDWALLSEGAYAIAAGALHVATNLDATLPTERGFALGNGSLVTALSHATGSKPLAGGKPFPGIYQRALAKAGGAQRPLAVGDRLNTDHVGARAAAIPGLHVLTGVNTARDVVLAPPTERPAYLHTDLRALLEPQPEAQLHADGAWVVGQARARVEDQHLVLDGVGSLRTDATITLDAYRALASAAWAYADAADGAALQVPEFTVVTP
ncbi:HAD-IIA family hydrolase [Actinomyces trachealis]|uniref:HAD-IIA family hydrolase n=1 Tax=Actinomyces trachealis TaxID=2763540 RepID=UPI001892C239|nr:HAD hydrolase-like protein [Actinomyces trachealis]